uniref:Uncharacterized protein n=1 Tax=Anguilla anguilla TaxID=7936 RepID=A0A0E9WBI9_ANGAN
MVVLARQSRSYHKQFRHTANSCPPILTNSL